MKKDERQTQEWLQDLRDDDEYDGCKFTSFILPFKEHKKKVRNKTTRLRQEGKETDMRTIEWMDEKGGGILLLEVSLNGQQVCERP